MINRDDDGTETVKLCDFGLTDFVNERGEVHLQACQGTMRYMAPEIKEDAMITQAVDVWAYGIVIYKLAVAYFPSTCRDYKDGQDPLPKYKRDWTTFSDTLFDMLLECT